MCAHLTTLNIFNVNANGCDSGYFCSGYGLSAWANTYVTGSTTDYPCTALPITPTTTTSVAFNSVFCPTKQSLKNFKSETAIVTCSLDTDCVLEDNTNTSCQCTVRSDGLGVCVPDISNDQVYAKYWNDCGTSNTISDQHIYVYWTYFTTYWTLAQSNLSCRKVFVEIQSLQDAKSAYDSAVALTATIFAMAAFY